MEFTFKNAHIYNSGVFETKDYTAKLNDTDPSAGSLSAFNNICVLPAFCDVHVHFREPGFFYKETIRIHRCLHNAQPKARARQRG